MWKYRRQNSENIVRKRREEKRRDRKGNAKSSGEEGRGPEEKKWTVKERRETDQPQRSKK